MHMIMTIRIFPVLLLLLLIASCATSPEFDSELFKQDTVPEQAVNEIDKLRNTKVLWGGLLVSSTNLEQGTQLEVLSYPLDSNQKPDISQAPQGRFILLDDRFLEPLDYSEGRIVTVTGELKETRSGEVGSAKYDFPVIDALEIYLWPKNGGQVEPRVHVGFGFIFGN